MSWLMVATFANAMTSKLLVTASIELVLFSSHTDCYLLYLLNCRMGKMSQWTPRNL